MNIDTGRSRRFHVKSRYGCRQCKRRKTKCNEQYPSCEKCVRRGLLCSFANGESSIIIIPASTRRHSNEPKIPRPISPSSSPHNHSVGSHTRTNKDTQFPASTQNAFSPTQAMSLADSIIPQTCMIPSNEVENLTLMHRYTLFTSQKLAATPEALTVWQDLIPPLAFEFDFLLHGLLAVTAVERALTDDSVMNYNSAIALHHYNLGLAIFRLQLTAITPQNIAALFVFSVFAVVHVFGFPLTSHDGLLSPLWTLNHMFALIRGCAIIVRSDLRRLEESPYKHLLLPQPKNPSRVLPTDIEEALTVLSLRNMKQHATEPALQDAFTETIYILRHTIILALDGCLRGQMAAAVPFVILMPEIVVLKVQEDDPMALVLVANYAAVLHWSRKVLWVKDWGKVLVNTIQRKLSQDWTLCIAWAISEVRKEDARRVDGF